MAGEEYSGALVAFVAVDPRYVSAQDVADLWNSRNVQRVLGDSRRA